MSNKNFTFTFFKNDDKIIEKNYNGINSVNNRFKFMLFECETVIDFEKYIFTRENEEYIFILNMLNKTCHIKLKTENVIIPIQVDYCDVIKEKNRYIIDYSIESEDAHIKMIIDKG